MKYKITNATPSINRTTGQQWSDNYGNLSWNVSVTGEKGENINFLKRSKAGNDPKVGDILDGNFVEEIGKTGNPYMKFVATPKEYGAPSGQGGYAKHAKDDFDPTTMLISYAKDVVIALINRQEDKDKLTTDNVISDLDIMTYHFVGLHKSIKEGSSVEEKKTEVAKFPQDDIDVEDIPF